MITLTLPTDQRRVLVRSFWLTLGASMSMPCVVFGWWWHTQGALMVGIAAATLTTIIWFVREDLVWRAYGAWNRRLVRPVGSVAARIVMAVCFFLVFVAARKTRPRLPPTQRSGSSTLWASRRSLTPDAYPSLFAAPLPGGPSGTWIADYLQWAKDTENLWAVSLLPFLAVLRHLEVDGQTHDSQGNIYTLF